MFPIPFNFPFRKKNGNITTIGDAISEGGGGEPYVLPTASASVKGGVKIGDGLEMDGETLKTTGSSGGGGFTLLKHILSTDDDKTVVIPADTNFLLFCAMRGDSKMEHIETCVSFDAFKTAVAANSYSGWSYGNSQWVVNSAASMTYSSAVNGMGFTYDAETRTLTAKYYRRSDAQTSNLPFDLYIYMM